MDLRDTPEEAAFRVELRAWLEENLPAGLQGHRGGATRFEGPEMRQWSRALCEAGYVGLTWPENVPSQRVLEKIGMRREDDAEHYGRTMFVYSAMRA